MVRVDDTGTPGSTVYAYALVTGNNTGTNTLTGVAWDTEGTAHPAFAAGATVTEVLTAGAMSPLPRGTLGYATVTANQGSITTGVDLTGMTATVTVGTGRRVRISTQFIFQSTVAADIFALTIQEGATILQEIDIVLAAASEGQTVSAATIIQPAAGSHTYKLSIARALGTGTGQMNATGNKAAWFLVEDIGV